MSIFSDVGDWFGSVFVREVGNRVTIGGLDTAKLINDVNAVWRNKNLVKYMFLEIRQYRIVVDRFFLPDCLYVFQQIYEFKGRKSSKYRIKQAIDHLQTETWLKATTEKHPDILDFEQLRRLKHTLFAHQVDTLKVYNEKVPQMDLMGFLLSTPPGCLSGETVVSFVRHNETITTTLRQAFDYYQQHAIDPENWDLAAPTYVTAYTGTATTLQKIYAVTECGVQDIYDISLVDGTTLGCTDSHAIQTDTGYLPAREIVGRRVLCYREGALDYVDAVAIAYRGQEMTYDIICEEPYHNFVANDIVVHNSGKTIMSIALSVCLHADVTFFIVPKATVTTVWYDGIVEELGPDARIWASTHGVPLTEDYDFYIFHYEALPMALYIAARLFDRKTPFIAIDESHNLNEITSGRTLRLVELTKLLKCQHTVFATGTPIKALGVEMIPLLRCIDKLFTASVEASFKAVFGATAKRANDILRNRLGLISHKIREDSYMTAPPPKQLELKIKVPNGKRYTIANVQAEMKKFMAERYREYHGNMKKYVAIYDQGVTYYEKTMRTPAQRDELKVYRKNVRIIIEGYDPIAHKDIAKAVKDFETQKIIPSLPQPLKNQFKDAVSIVKYAKMRVLGEALAIFGRYRSECAAELVLHGKLEEIITAADKKTIVFSSYIPALEAGTKYFRDLGFNALQIYGEYTKNLTERVVMFKKDPDINPLLATLQSLSASQTLIVANVVIFLDAPFREYIRDQAFHRVFRIGQDVQTYIYLCLLDTGSEPNISTRSQDILAWSQTQVNDIFGSASKEEAAGIVKRMHLNPSHSGMGMLIDMVKNVKIF